MSLSGIVFPIICVIGVMKYLGTPREKRSDDQNKYFFRFIIGLLTVWFSIEYIDPKSQNIDKYIIGFIGLFGFYLSLFYGVNLFSTNSKK